MDDPVYICVRCGAVFDEDDIDDVDEACTDCGGRLEFDQ